MCLRILVFSSFLLFLGAFGLNAQVTLFQENFDDCALGPDWLVNIAGNPNAVWYVGDSVLNNDNNGQSMNGSCFLFIDDDASGNNTPPYVIDFRSPAFDISGYPTVELSLDVHYRDWGQANEFLEIRLTDGTTETLLARFDQTNQTGSNLTQFATLKYDLSLMSLSPNLRLIIRYDDAGGFDWWAGVDNISVIGKGTGTNILAETFNACQKPAGWETQILTGEQDWSFGKATNPKAANGNSINGSCMAYFDDDILSDSAPYSAARLYSPWFDGTLFGNFELNFDLIHRYISETFSVYVQNGAGEENLVASWAENVGGPLFSNPVHQILDLSPYRAKEMRLVFEYNDGNDWGWWTGIDNVKVTGSGAANDLCTNALDLTTGDDCKPGDNRNAVLDGPLPACTGKAVGGLWYRWQADFSGVARLTTHADFNDVVNVYTGDCVTPDEVLCDNYDEHGFQGEGTLFNAQAGTQYLIRVSGQDGGFGRPRGDLCVELGQAPGFPAAPPNDDCPNALPLTVDGPCVAGSNRHASTSAALPSLNLLARADVWYTFTAPISPSLEKLEVRSNADFSDIITVYGGGCANLTEIAGNHRGHALELTTALGNGQTYWVQIAGNFATVEGELCAQVVTTQNDAPDNDDCLQATIAAVNGPCAAGSNLGAGFSGYQPGCVVQADRDVWFKFTAPAAGSVRLNSGADFDHVLAVWQGNCANLTPVFCAENPLRCNGYLLVGNLVPGQTYYVQIAAWNSPAGFASGEVCLQVLDGGAQPPFEPLALQIQEQCVDIDLAKLHVSAVNGVPPYEFLGQADGQLLASGSQYLVIVTDAIGCEQSLTGIADDCTEAGCLIANTFTAQNPLCAGVADGAITAVPSGGDEPYSFLWSNGAAGAALDNLEAGTYLVTITDAAGCELVALQTLIDPPALQMTVTASDPSENFCNGGISVAVSGGTGAVSFAWTLDGQPFSTEQNLAGLCAGLYELVISDQNGCTATLSVTLTQTIGTADPNDAFYAEIQPNPLKDKGILTVKLPAAAELHLALSDGAGRKLHEWSAGTILEQNVPLDFSDLPTGMYWLKVIAGKEAVVRKVVVAR